MGSGAYIQGAVLTAMTKLKVLQEALAKPPSPYPKMALRDRSSLWLLLDALMRAAVTVWNSR